MKKEELAQFGVNNLGYIKELLDESLSAYSKLSNLSNHADTVNLIDLMRKLTLNVKKAQDLISVLRKVESGLLDSNNKNNQQLASDLTRAMSLP